MEKSVLYSIALLDVGLDERFSISAAVCDKNRHGFFGVAGSHVGLPADYGWLDAVREHD